MYGGAKLLAAISHPKSLPVTFFFQFLSNGFPFYDRKRFRFRCYVMLFKMASILPSV